jgi:hypothetical protein
VFNIIIFSDCQLSLVTFMIFEHPRRCKSNELTSDQFLIPYSRYTKHPINLQVIYTNVHVSFIFHSDCLDGI